MKADEIKENIYWVGAIDKELRNFHGYLTQRGSTYNAYLIIDKKITLIDTVKKPFVNEMMERIKSITDPAKIDYIVSNHVEMDHSGSLPEIIKIAKNAKVVCSPNGEKGLKAHYQTSDWKIKIVKAGETLELGEKTLNFVLTPMVHWPDNMVDYLKEDKILFSNDAFGQHYATNPVDFDTEVDAIHDPENIEEKYKIAIKEAKKYFANIVLPYRAQVSKVLESVDGLDIHVIAPSHGIIWQDDKAGDILAEYQKWAANKTGRKSLIVYDTMWGSTKKMADILVDVFQSKGYEVVLANLQEKHISDIMTDFIDSEYICVGSPTLNNNIMPTVAAFLTYLKGLSPRDRKAISFGSFGWGGQGVTQIEQYFNESGFDVKLVEKIQYIPSEKKLDEFKQRLEALV